MANPDPNSTQSIQQTEFREIEALEAKLAAAQNLPDELRAKGQNMIQRLRRVIRFGGYSREFEPVAKYIDWIVKIPFGKYTQDNLDIQKVREDLDKYHYGLDETKQRILEYLAVLKLNTDRLVIDEKEQQSVSAMATLKGSSANAPILCFVGIQGVGKTSLAKSIANALGRQFYRISLGGMTTVNSLRGLPKSEPDSDPGQIVKGLVRAEVMNPLILLDEIDKVSERGGARADIMAALLEVLDPEQNATFGDNYLDYPLNLSKVMFITTANNLGGLSAALLDRLEIIRFSSYTDDDKIQIGKNYMLPKVLRATGLNEDQIIIEDGVWPLIVRPLGFDAGIRELERTITRLARKVAMMIVQGEAQQIIINPQNFRQFIPEDFGIIS
jgi:ATP-dependent Lon protease